MLEDFIKAIIVGIAASVPIGPIAIFVFQKTMTKGFHAGFITSLGSTLVDTVFSIVAIFALAYVQSFIEGNPIPIFIGGGLVVIVLGLSMTLSNPVERLRRKSRGRAEDGKKDISITDFLSSAIMGFSNPGAILVMFALMAFFGLAEQRRDWSIFPVVLGVAAGSAVYWLGITAALNIFRKNIRLRTLIWINRLTGIIVMILGLATIAEGLMRIFNK